MEGLIMAAQLLLGLSLLVFVHEFGHFFAAKMFGMRVEKFFIFFDAGGKKLWSKTIGDTEYGIGWLPIGGYVKISGMIDESMDKEQMDKPPEEWEFRSKPAWQRFIVMIGGIVVNVIVGIIIFVFYLSYYEGGYIPVDSLNQGIYAYEMGEEVGLKTGDKLISINGESPKRLKDYSSIKVFFGSEITYDRNGTIGTVQISDTMFRRASEPFIAPYKFDIKVGSFPKDTSTYAMEAGLQEDDVISGINGTPLINYGDLKSVLEQNKNSAVNVNIKRGAEALSINCKVSDEGKIGFSPVFDYKTPNSFESYGVADVFGYGVQEGWQVIYYNALGLVYIFQGKVNVVDSVQSPVGIAKFYGGTWIWSRFWKLTGVLSFILAFMNLLPIPALDGGHMVFIIVEVIRGKPLSDKFLERAQMVGMLILLPLMALVLGKDIWLAIRGFFGL